MVRYTFRAKQELGKMIEGSIDAETQDAAVAKVIQMGYAPVDVWAGTEPAFRTTPRKERSWTQFSRRVTMAEILAFTRLVADLIDAGVPVLKALRNIERQCKPSYFKNVIGQIGTMLQDGATFSSALSQYPNIFSPLYVHIVRAGETGGNLNEVLTRLAEFLEKDEAVRSQLRLSLIYPALILFVGTATIFIVLTWVIPRISVIFEDMGADLPVLTVVLMAVSHFFAQFWPGIILAIGGILFYLRRIADTPDGKMKLDGWVLNIPFMGSLQQDTDLGRFVRTMGTLLDNGVVIIPSLQSAESVVNNAVLRRKVKEIEEAVVNGEGLTEGFRRSGLFQEAAISMISVGEETGKIHAGLYKLASYYERRSQHMIKVMTSLIEPLLILGVGSVVAFIVMAMLLPIFRINQLIR